MRHACLRVDGGVGEGIFALTRDARRGTLAAALLAALAVSTHSVPASYLSLFLGFRCMLLVHCDSYGLLSTGYFAEGLRLIRDRMALAEPGSAKQLVAIVFTTQESVEWCQKTLVKVLQQTAEKVVCANTSGFVLS